MCTRAHLQWTSSQGKARVGQKSADKSASWTCRAARRGRPTAAAWQAEDPRAAVDQEVPVGVGVRVGPVEFKLYNQPSLSPAAHCIHAPLVRFVTATVKKVKFSHTRFRALGGWLLHAATAGLRRWEGMSRATARWKELQGPTISSSWTTPCTMQTQRSTFIVWPTTLGWRRTVTIYSHKMHRFELWQTDRHTDGLIAASLDAPYLKSGVVPRTPALSH